MSASPVATTTALPEDAYQLTVTTGVVDPNGLPLNEGLDQTALFDVAVTESPENDTLATATVTGLTANAGPIAVGDLIEHYRRQAHAMRSTEMGTAIVQVAHWLLFGLRRRLSEERQQNGARSNVFACGSDD